jgi:alpha-beta hydrolase superfamily lysophospholipase
LHDDLEARFADVRARAEGAPVILYGHSMGGLVVAGYCLSNRPRSDLVVLSAPGLDSTLATWKKRIVPVLNRVTPRLPIPNGVDPETLSRDPEVGVRLATDTLCATASTARFGAEALREQARVRELASGGLGVPTLVLHGEDDALVPPSASRVFEGAPATERRAYPGLRHELHNEPEGPAVIDDVIAWARARVPIAVRPRASS